ncbi:calmodulin-like [Convolutriloba macropyga]|uniref:calmodulin-like n=1 Tax=Convolutriloba macropyga TaxID=536237 RepID=UPI003F51B9F9
MDDPNQSIEQESPKPVKAKNLTPDQVAELREAFNLFDTDGSGSISTLELGEVLATLGEPATEEELATIIAEVDKDGNGEIDFPEFLQMMAGKLKERKLEDDLQEAFRIFDQNGDGLVSPAELKFVMVNLGEEIDDEDLDVLVAQVDKDGDGQLNYQEFVQLMT